MQRARQSLSEESQRLAAGAGLEVVLDPARRNIDDMHRSVTLAGDEQFVAAERHVHWLMSDLDRGLLAERWINQADGVALHAGDPDHAVVRAVAGDLRRLGRALEPHRVRDLLARGV